MGYQQEIKENRMKITIEIDGETIVQEGDAIVGCVINPKTDHEDQPNSATIVVGKCDRKDIVLRYAYSMLSVIEQFFESDFERLVIKAVVRKILENDASDLMEIDVARKEFRKAQEGENQNAEKADA